MTFNITIERLRMRLTLNQCHQADVRDARTLDGANQAQLDTEQAELCAERTQLLRQLEAAGGTWPGLDS